MTLGKWYFSKCCAISLKKINMVFFCVRYFIKKLTIKKKLPPPQGFIHSFYSGMRLMKNKRNLEGVIRWIILRSEMFFLCLLAHLWPPVHGSAFISYANVSEFCF